MEMTLAKALRYKKRIVTKINAINSRITNCITASEDDEFSAKLSDLLKDRDIEINNLLYLKVEIQKANVPILGHIYKLSELKSLAQLIQGLNVTPNTHTRYYGGDTPPKMKAQIDELERDERLEKIHDEIEDVQGMLDAHNSTTKINIQ